MWKLCFRHGKIQSVKLLPRDEAAKSGAAVVAFMDIKSASKAHNTENKLESTVLHTQYSEPTATGSAVTVTRTHIPESHHTPGRQGASGPSSAGSSASSGQDASSRPLYGQRNVANRYTNRSADSSG